MFRGDLGMPARIPSQAKVSARLTQLPWTHHLFILGQAKARGRLCSRTADGQPLMMLGTQFDISARNQAEEAARQALEQRELARRHRDELVASIDGIVWEADAQTFCFSFVSEQAERWLGHPTARWLEPDFWADHIHPDDR